MKTFEVQSQHFGHGPRAKIWTDFKMSYSSVGSFAFPPIINFVDQPADHALWFVEIWTKYGEFSPKNISAVFAETEIRKAIMFNQTGEISLKKHLG